MENFDEESTKCLPQDLKGKKSLKVGRRLILKFRNLKFEENHLKLALICGPWNLDMWK
jgi:hypothetical protein